MIVRGKGDGRGRTAGTGPGGMEGRWGRNWCKLGRGGGGDVMGAGSRGWRGKWSSDGACRDR